MPEKETKSDNLAKLIDGQVILNPLAEKICIKGIVSGFPVKLEAIQTGYPFGVSYSVETSSFSGTSRSSEPFKLVIMTKYARGPLAVITRFLFFEKQGQKIDLSALDSAFIFKFDHSLLAKKFVHYGGVAEDIKTLEKKTHFNEIVIKSDAGIYLSQPVSFDALDLEQCKEIFNMMAKLAQVLFEAF